MADVKFVSEHQLYEINLGDPAKLAYPVQALRFAPDGVVAYIVHITNPEDDGMAWVLVSQFNGELRGHPLQRVRE